MCWVMSSSRSENSDFSMSRPRCGVWLGDQISSLPSFHCATQFSGSSGACEMKGYE